MKFHNAGADLTSSDKGNEKFIIYILLIVTIIKTTSPLKCSNSGGCFDIPSFLPCVFRTFNASLISLTTTPSHILIAIDLVYETPNGSNPMITTA